MKRFIFALTLALAVEHLPGQVVSKNSTAPMLLFTSGGGTISPLQGGQQLKVGNTYSITAIPAAGYKFRNWQQVHVSIDAENVQYPSGATTGSSKTTVAAQGKSVTTPSLGFTVSPVTTSTSNYGFTTHTEGTGWKANFVKK